VINVIRLVTVHPFLVHFTIGILPVMVLGYAAAVWLKSERWSFVGDAAAAACAGITLLTMSFGLISNFYLRWPGGLWLWHYLHMGLGIGSTLALVIFATIRLMTRRRVGSLEAMRHCHSAIHRGKWYWSVDRFDICIHSNSCDRLDWR